MTYEEESYVLDSLYEIKKLVRSPTFKQLIIETHENNIMLKQIIKFINAYLSNVGQDNIKDFNMNVIANLISNGINKYFKYGNNK